MRMAMSAVSLVRWSSSGASSAEQRAKDGKRACCFNGFPEARRSESKYLCRPNSRQLSHRRGPVSSELL